jgi:hypothetical protein
MLFRVRRDPIVYAAMLIPPCPVARKYLRKRDAACRPCADGLLMQANKDQAQPDLKSFTQSRK